MRFKHKRPKPSEQERRQRLADGAKAILYLQELIDCGLLVLTKGEINPRNAQEELDRLAELGVFPNPDDDDVIAKYGTMIAVELGMFLPHVAASNN